MLENALRIGSLTHSVPSILSHEKQVEFFEKYSLVLKDFSDFKKVGENDSDLFFKLITKEIIFIIKSTSRNEFLKKSDKINLELFMVENKLSK